VQLYILHEYAAGASRFVALARLRMKEFRLLSTERASQFRSRRNKDVFSCGLNCFSLNNLQLLPVGAVQF
jgi:hypothetical protein